jgi:hypothetical protein
MGNKNLKLFILFWLIIAVAGCAAAERKSAEPLGQPGQPAKPPQAAPVITQFFASPQIAPGRVWRVYLQASDADGDMKEFICTIHQAGVGTYPVSITRIKEGSQKSLSGYLFLNVTAFRNLDFVELTLAVQVRDRAGQFSEPVKFPLSINSRYAQEPPPEGVFQENNLGPIMIQLRTLGDDDSPGIFERHPFRR